MRADPIATYTLIVLELAVAVLVIRVKIDQILERRRFIADVDRLMLNGERWMSKF